MVLPALMTCVCMCWCCCCTGVAWFSLASLLLPAALSEPVRAAGLALPAVLLARMCVVSWLGTIGPGTVEGLTRMGLVQTGVGFLWDTAAARLGDNRPRHTPLRPLAWSKCAALIMLHTIFVRACVCLMVAQGLGEGVALPSMSNLVANHVPPSAKARALGMSFTGFHTGD